jgi:hypothetical protein
VTGEQQEGGSGEEQPLGAAGQPSEEELRAAFEEQMRRIRVDDVLLQTAVTLVNLAGRRMGLPGPEGERAETPDLRQARLAIDATRALVPMLPDEPQRAVRDALSQLQIAFARATQGPEGGEAAAGGAAASGEQPTPGPQDPAASDRASKEDEQAEAERAKTRSRIWTPPGS